MIELATMSSGTMEAVEAIVVAENVFGISC
jgi:hypothetical protein